MAFASAAWDGRLPAMSRPWRLQGQPAAEHEPECHARPERQTAIQETPARHLLWTVQSGWLDEPD